MWRILLRSTIVLLAALTLVPADAGEIHVAGPAPAYLTGATATLTDDGHILVYGGGGASVWNPYTLRWDNDRGPQPYLERYQHTATLTRSGSVVVVGGIDTADVRFGARAALATTALWHAAPAEAGVTGLPGPDIAGVWSAGPTLLEARVGHAVALLPDDDVLVIGGAARAVHAGAAGPMLRSIERLGRNTARPRAPMSQGRAYHTASVLADGRVLVAGGSGDDGVALRSVELYDPQLDQWRSAPAMLAARSGHSATVLADGSVLVVGGFDERGLPLRSSELLRPGADHWEGAGELDTARARHAALLLPDGDVLVSGGEGGTLAVARTLERWHAATRAWSPAGQLGLALHDHRAVLMKDGGVLLFGRDPYSGTAALVWRAGAVPAPTIDQAVNGTLTPLADGRVLQAGGSRHQEVTAQASLFDPQQRGWLGLRSMHFARSGHRALQLRDGRVLVLGGEIHDDAGQRDRADDSGASDAVERAAREAERTRLYPAELWDPRSERWTLAQSLLVPNGAWAEPAQLADGRVLLAGIDYSPYGSGTVASVRYWDPVRDTLSAAQPVERPRPGGQAVLLADGQIAFAGGANDGADGNQFDLWSAGHGWRSEHVAPVSLNGLRLVALEDGRLLAWQLPRSDTAPMVLLLWSPGRGWLSLSLPHTAGGELLRSPQLQARALPGGDLLLVLAGAHSWRWRAATQDWLPIAQDARWESLEALVPSGVDGALAFHVVADSHSVFKPLTVSELDLPHQHWRTLGVSAYRPRHQPALVALGGDTVMVAGGGVASVQLWHAQHDAWSETGYLTEALDGPQALRLADGRVLLVGLSQEESPALVCNLWQPVGEQWSPCGRFQVDADGRRRLIVLRALSGGRALLVFGARQAMIWEAGAGWSTTRLRLPASPGIPPGSEQGTAYLVPIASFWDPQANAWADATDALIANEVGRRVATAKDGSRLALAGPVSVVRWSGAEGKLYRYELAAHANHEELNTVVETPDGCVAAWVAQPPYGFAMSHAASAPSVYAGNLATKKWQTTRALVLQPSDATGLMLPDGTLLLAGSNEAGAGATRGYQRFHAGCNGITDPDRTRGLELPTASAAAVPGAAVGASGAQAAAAQAAAKAAAPRDLAARWWAQLRRTLAESGEHLQGTLVVGALLLLLAWRLAQRRWIYVEDDDGHSTLRRIDRAVAAAALPLWLALLGAPPGWWTSLPACLVALAGAVSMRRLWSNLATPRARWLAALPLVLLSVVAVLTLGGAVVGTVADWSETLLDRS